MLRTVYQRNELRRLDSFVVKSIGRVGPTRVHRPFGFFKNRIDGKRNHPKAMTPLRDVIDVLRSAAGFGGQKYNGNLGYLYAYNVLE